MSQGHMCSDMNDHNIIIVHRLTADNQSHSKSSTGQMSPGRTSHHISYSQSEAGRTSSPRYSMVLVLPGASSGCWSCSSMACLALNLKKSISSAAASISAWITVFPWRRQTVRTVRTSQDMIQHGHMCRTCLPGLPYLSDHGLGDDFSSLGSAEGVGCLEENLGSVLDGLQVPLSPRRHRCQDGFVDELLHQSHSG